MREIKFRVWAENDEYPEGKMYRPEDGPDFLINLSGDLIHTHKKGDISFDGVWARIGYNGIILMQFTGLTDKNGKEIYEGDILTFKGVYAGYVAFEYAEFITKAKIDYAMSPKAPNSQEVYEIIGNIYENPDLLTDSD